MYKKKLGYVLFIVFLFSFFNVEVKAAKEMSCVYYDDEDAYKFVQNGNGTFEVHYGKTNKVVPNGTIAWAGEWTKQTKINLKLYSSCDTGGIEGKNFSSVVDCPQGFIVKNKRKKEYYLVNQIPDETSGMCITTHSKKSLEMKGKQAKAYNDNSKGIEEDKVKTHKEQCENIPVGDLWIDKDSGAQASCLYAHNLKDERGCMSVQLDMTSEGVINPRVKIPKGVSVDTKNSSDTLIGEIAMNNRNGYCPSLYINEEYNKKNLAYKLGVESGSNGTWFLLNFVEAKGSNLLDPSLDIADYDYNEFNISFIDTTGDDDFQCSDIFGEDETLIDLLHTLVSLIKIAIPIIVIVLGSLDFVNAIFAGEEGKMKKAQGKFIKRLIIAVIIFLVPSLLHFLLDIVSKIWPNLIDADLCGIL